MLQALLDANCCLPWMVRRKGTPKKRCSPFGVPLTRNEKGTLKKTGCCDTSTLGSPEHAMGNAAVARKLRSPSVQSLAKKRMTHEPRSTLIWARVTALLIGTFTTVVKSANIVRRVGYLLEDKG